MKIAMWSGPRNLSTAMMYAFAARSDFAVTDEPFYAPFLAATGRDHPMHAQILAAHDSDPVSVSRWLGGPIPDGKTHWYQKHMPHHMEPRFPLDWAQDCVHVHLIRHPARVIASYAAKREAPELEDIGFSRQAAFFDRFPGPVLDSIDIRNDPQTMLRKLCDAIGLDWNPAMLSWPAGGHASDGIWASHWYGAVHRSTGFAGPEDPLPDLPPSYQGLLHAALPVYERLAEQKLQP